MLAQDSVWPSRVTLLLPTHHQLCSGKKNSANITAGNPLAGGADDRIQVLPSGQLVIHQLVADDFSTSPYRCFVSNANTHIISMSPQTFTLNEGTVCTVYISMFLMCVVCM